MKPTLDRSFRLKFTSRGIRRGFALVVTLTLMVLLSILALGLLSLSSIELRKSGVAQGQSLARQNALLALNLAIGELQKNLGPDKRTSATADLISGSSKNPHWVGAWNTEGGFRNWLVSGNENVTPPTDLATDSPAPPFIPDTSLAAATPTDPGVTLVGQNSAGPATTNHVIAPKVDLKDPSAAHPSGRYAWWVGDEGAKANLAATVGELPENSTEERLKFLASSPNRGFATLGGPWQMWLPDGNDALLVSADGKLVSRKQVSLTSEALSADKKKQIQDQLTEEEKLRFHDFTVSSAGVLSDTKFGGLKKDLSIAFEIPEQSFINSEFTRKLSKGEPDYDLAYVTNHADRLSSGNTFVNRNTKTAVNYRDTSWPADYVFRGPTFDQLRDHYQLYRRIDKPFDGSASIAAQTFMPNATVTKGRNKTQSPSGDYNGKARDFPNHNPYEVADTYEDSGTKTRLRPMVTEMAPELIRFTYTLAIQSFKDTADPTKYRIRMIMTPFFTLHNPYNVTLNSSALWYKIQRAELHMRIEYKDPATGNNVSTNKGQDVNFRSMLQAYFGDDNKISGDGLSYDSVDYFVSDDGTPSGSLTLKPGETKLYTVRGNNAIPAEDIFSTGKNRNIFMQADLGNLFSTGVYLTVRSRTGWHTSTDFTIPAGTSFKVSINNKIEGQGTSPNTPQFGWDAPEYHTIWGKLVSPGTSEPVPNGAHLSWDQTRLMQFFANDYWTGRPSGTTSSTVNSPESIEAAASGARRYIGRVDMYLKPTNDTGGWDNNISLATHNPRAMVQSTTMTGGQGPASTRGPATWTASVVGLDPNTSATPGFDNRFWGSGTTLAEGGQRNIVLYDIPRAPITSIASFQNANISRTGCSPAYALGNSYASPYVPADGLSWKSPINGNYWVIDNSYVFNEALFDSYFFSGVNPGRGSSGWRNPLSKPSVALGTSDPSDASLIQDAIDKWKSGEKPLMNHRLKFRMPTGRGTADAEDELDVVGGYQNPQTSLDTPSDVRPHNSIAAYALFVGSFNLNSTSVEAWRAILAGARGAPVDHLNPSGGMDVSKSDSDTPFPRSTMPGADDRTGSDENLWNGFRSLSDPEIESLAKEIVIEIKERARKRPGSVSPRPFTTFAEFINRRIGPASNETSSKGALQAAIDRSINTSPESLTDQPVISAETHYQTKRNPNGASETTTVDFANPDALASATIAGTPQWFSQADLLEQIGPLLSVRSDTFTIRAYGENVDPKTGRILGRAWVEATVQREPSYVNPTDNPALPLASGSLSDKSKKYGRRFNIVSLRWLSPTEI